MPAESDSPRPVLQDSRLLQHAAWLDGQWRDDTPSNFEVRNPLNQQLLASVADCAARETRWAIAAAERALPAWKSKTAGERANILQAWHALILANSDDLARLMTLEQGKPLHEAQGEVAYGASFVQWFAEEAKRVYGDTVPSQHADQRLLVIKQAIGVCAAITPWNFPIAMITRKVAPALAAGCTVIVKPAEQTPLCALALAELSQRAGMPPGVFNVITAGAENSIEVGEVLCAAPSVRHLSFTGSTEVGRILMAQCAPSLKRLSLELGGHAPFIVFEDADIEAAVAGAIASKYRNAGQTCVCANRFIVHTSIYDRFISQLGDAVRALHVGDGLQEGTDIGPLIDEAALQKVGRHIDDALAAGARLICGGKPAAGSRFAPPTVLAEVTPAMLIAREETFGPVAAVMRFSSEDEAVALANASEFGLAAYFYGRDIGRIWRVAEALEYGMVGVNTGLISNASVPFGGIKQSGFGREGGRYGIEEYVDIKYLCLGGINN